MFIRNRVGRRLSTLMWAAIAALPVTAWDGQSGAVTSPSHAEQESFLTSAAIAGDPPADGRPSWRVSLTAGAKAHDATIETADGRDPTGRNYQFNVAAYELNKLLGLDLVPPSVVRLVREQPASLTWWVDDVAMSEVERRRKRVSPPDQEQWRRQMDALRVFDELIGNGYRSPSPALYLNSVWDNLLITKDWRIWAIDHGAAFQNRTELQDPDSLSRCPRTLLMALQQLSRARFEQVLSQYISAEQLDTLDVRRALLVRHFNQQIARKGEGPVLYDLGPNR